MDDDDYDVQEAFGEALELNAAIVQKTRELVHEVRVLAKAHLSLAEKYDEIGDALTAAARASAERLGDAIVAELGNVAFGSGDDEEEEEAIG